MNDELMDLFAPASTPDMAMGDHFLFGTYLAIAVIGLPILLILAWVTGELFAEFVMNRLRRDRSTTVEETQVATVNRVMESAPVVGQREVRSQSKYPTFAVLRSAMGGHARREGPESKARLEAVL